MHVPKLLVLVVIALLLWMLFDRGMHYRVRSTNVKSERWYPTKQEAIAAFERSCKRAKIAPPKHYPPTISGDLVTNNDIAYPRTTCAAGVRDGHGWVYVDARNDVSGD